MSQAGTPCTSEIKREASGPTTLVPAAVSSLETRVRHAAQGADVPAGRGADDPQALLGPLARRHPRLSQNKTIKPWFWMVLEHNRDLTPEVYTLKGQGGRPAQGAVMQGERRRTGRREEQDGEEEEQEQGEGKGRLCESPGSPVCISTPSLPLRRDIT